MFVDKLLLTFGSRPDVRCWKRVVGFDELRKIAFGVPGESDLQGIVRPGKFLAIEAKTGKATRTPKQETWAKMIQSFGGIYILARCLDFSDLEDACKRALADFEAQI